MTTYQIIILIILAIILIYLIYIGIFEYKRKKDWNIIRKAKHEAEEFSATVCSKIPDSNKLKNITKDGLETAFMSGFVYAYYKEYQKKRSNEN